MTEEKYNWTERISWEAGLAIPVNRICNLIIAEFATHGINVEILKSGCLIKHVEFVMSGYTDDFNHNMAINAINAILTSIGHK